MPRLRQVGRDAAHPFAQAIYAMLFGDRDPVAHPGTATGTPGNWWTVFALVPDCFEHAVRGFQFYRGDKRAISAKLEQIEKEPKGPSPMARCDCGAIVLIRIPCLCPKCKDPKPYWTDANGKVLHLSKMDLGRLTSMIRTLATRVEQPFYAEGTARAEIEVALDIVYADIGTRDKEIEQQRRILAGLTRALEK